MKINIVLPSFPRVMTGGYKIMLEYANELARKGDDVMVYFVMKLPYCKRRHTDLYCWLKSWWFKRKKPSWISIDKRIRTKSVYSLNNYEIRNADVLFFTECQVALSLDKLSRRKGVTVNLIQDYEKWILPSTELLEESFRRADYNIVISDYLVPIVEKATGTRPAVCYNAFDVKRFHVKKPITDRGRHTVAMLFHQDERKGCKYGIQALRLCKQQFPDLRVNLFGLYVPQTDLEDWITFEYNPKDLCALYNDVSIFLTPSLNEGWGLTAMESMACGCALVSTDVDGLRVFAIDGQTALTAPPADGKALANRLTELMTDDNKRQKIAENGYDFVQQFTWDSAIERLCSLFLKFIDERKQEK